VADDSREALRRAEAAASRLSVEVEA
jgi:hypothetical protein